jgi:hypothetical protein
VGVRWSAPGVGNLLKLGLAKRYHPDDYERLWRPPGAVDATLVSPAAMSTVRNTTNYSYARTRPLVDASN